MILLTGGTGFLGQKLLENWTQKNFRIRVLCLPGESKLILKHPNVEVWIGDLKNPESLKGITKGIEVVYHFAGIILSDKENEFDLVNHKGTENLLSLSVKTKVNQFIYISSASVTLSTLSPYSKSKIDAEMKVKSSGINYTIIRPTLIMSKYGGLEFNIFFDTLRRFPVFPLIDRGKYLKQPVFAEDIVQAIFSIHMNEKTFNKTYNLSGGESLSLKEFANLCNKELKRKSLFISLPRWLVLFIVKLLRLILKKPPIDEYMVIQLTEDADLCHANATKDFNYRPRSVRDFISKALESRSL